MEKAKAKAAALRDKSKEALAAASEKIDDVSRPCVQCGSKAGVLRYDCSQCNTAKFCFKCTNYCSVTHAVVPVFTTGEKVVHMKDSAAEKSAELYKKALLKWKNRSKGTNKAGGTEEGAAAEGGEAIDGGADNNAAAAAPASAVQASIAAAAEDPNREKVDEYTTKSVCRLCFRSSVQTLDLGRNFDIVGPYDNDINATIIVVHGGGNSRGSLRRMAEQLIQYKVRCILLDLPGHGGRMDEPLTLESAIEAVHVASTTVMQQAVEKDAKAGLLLLMGVGLGGYVAMEYLGRAPQKKFDGAVIVNAGMGVGRDEASLVSRAALSLATSASQSLGARIVTQAALRELKKVPTLMKDEAHQNLVDTGYYFHSATEQLQMLRDVTTKASLGRFFGPVMFMDGSRDFHDMVDVYTKIAVDNELRTFRRGGDSEETDGAANDDDTAEGGLIILSRSIQYPAGNHHFMHDTRFADESYADIAVFVQQLVDRATIVGANPSLVLSAEELVEVLAKQKEAAEIAAREAAAAAEEASKNSFFSKAKAMGAGLLNKGNASSSSSSNNKKFHASATSLNEDDGAASNAATVGSSHHGDDYAPVISSGPRTSVNSIAVPFSAAAPAEAEESYTAEEQQTPALVEETPAAAEPAAATEVVAEEAAPAAEEEAAPATEAAAAVEEPAAEAEAEPGGETAEGEVIGFSSVKGKGKKGKKNRN